MGDGMVLVAVAHHILHAVDKEGEAVENRRGMPEMDIFLAEGIQQGGVDELEEFNILRVVDMDVDPGF